MPSKDCGFWLCPCACFERKCDELCPILCDFVVVSGVGDGMMYALGHDVCEEEL